MPRAFSSGALSIESNERYFTFGLCLASTFVMHAVSVVLPWSICPIVPTFTCGFALSNFSFAMSQLLQLLDGCALSGLRSQPLTVRAISELPGLERGQ